MITKLCQFLYQSISNPFLSFLTVILQDLPEPLPMKQRQKRLKQKLILLRDPDGDDWPVIYHDRNNIKVLASGWNAFRKANKVRPGDECTFVADESDRGIFHVHILKS